MKNMIFMALLALPLAAGAADWTDTDIGFEAVTATSLLVDWGQTRDIQYASTKVDPIPWAPGRAPQSVEIRECNPLLGPHPSNARINAYFSGALVGQWVIANALSGTSRKLFLGTVTVVELRVIGRNKELGMSVRF